MNIGLHGRDFGPDIKPYVKQVLDILLEKKVSLYISKSFEPIITQAFPSFKTYTTFETVTKNCPIDYLVSLGGDGTLLETIAMIGRSEKPVLGINTGRLGFLATTQRNEIEDALNALLNKAYSIDSRALLKLESDCEIFGDLDFALNEFTIIKTDSSSMITVHAFIDGEYLNSYWSDGLIVSTPTGSTGYSLSCGGPIVLPHSNNFVITPVSAHNLNVRPLIVSDESVISFEIEGRSNKFLVSLDSRSESVDSKVQLAVRKEDFKAKLIKFNDSNYLDTLRQKLNWGLDLRN